MKTDSLFYRLFQDWPELALNLLNLAYTRDSYQFVSEEIKQTGFRIDGLLKPTGTDPEQPLIFVEVQYQPDPDFYGRFFTEIMLYCYRQKPARRWLALVIYPSRTVEKPAPIEFEALMNLPQLHKIYLEDYQNRTEPSLAFIRLLAGSPEETVVWAQELVRQREQLSMDALDFIETVLVYKLPHLNREDIKAMLALNDIELKQTRFYQEIAQEERQEGEVRLLQRILTKRFGPLPTWAMEKLKQAEIEQLETWGERVLEANTLANIFD